LTILNHLRYSSVVLAFFLGCGIVGALLPTTLILIVKYTIGLPESFNDGYGYEILFIVFYGSIMLGCAGLYIGLLVGVGYAQKWFTPAVGETLPRPHTKTTADSSGGGP
jgi:hypothetical protein